MIKRILYGLLVVLLVTLAIVGYFLYQKPPDSAADQEAAYRLTSIRLLEDYQLNEEAANKKYLGKWIEVAGPVNLINADDGMIYLGLPESSASVSCLIDSSLRTAIHQLKAGDMVTIKGYCSGYLIDVQMTRVQLVR